MKLILHVFLYCVFWRVSGIQYVAQVHIALLNTALNVWQSSCPCLLKAGITDVNHMADIHFKQDFSSFIFAILFQSPLPTPPSFSTIIRATNAGWLGYVVLVFACAANREWLGHLSLFPTYHRFEFSSLLNTEILGGGTKRRDMGRATSSTCHGSLLLVSSWTSGPQRVKLRTESGYLTRALWCSPVSACQFKTKEVSDVARANFLIVAKLCF